ncbi:hypothetical protein HDU84_002386 [Entophlyctis sp. JEL0112]|nr:hypothetical protein HDU84_002386 [Entophlyctis sp. JEL0112]
MGKTAIIFGYGSGISASVGKKFGSLGFRLALVSRSQMKLDLAAENLAKENITARGYAADLRNFSDVPSLVSRIRNDLGPVQLIHWNVGAPLGDVLSIDPNTWSEVFNITTISLSCAVQSCLSDLEFGKGAVLVTGSGLELDNPEYAKMAANRPVATMAVGKAATRKYVSILHHALEPKGVFVGEVAVLGPVKGAGEGHTDASITPEGIADKFHELWINRRNCFVEVSD